jgi:hypothetical protein
MNSSTLNVLPFPALSERVPLSSSSRSRRSLRQEPPIDLLLIRVGKGCYFRHCLFGCLHHSGIIDLGSLSIKSRPRLGNEADNFTDLQFSSPLRYLLTIIGGD